MTRKHRGFGSQGSAKDTKKKRAAEGRQSLQVGASPLRSVFLLPASEGRKEASYFVLIPVAVSPYLLLSGWLSLSVPLPFVGLTPGVRGRSPREEKETGGTGGGAPREGAPALILSLYFSSFVSCL